MLGRLVWLLYERWHLTWSRIRPRSKHVGPDPVVDPTQPVSNPALIEAIESFDRHVSPESDWALKLALAKAVYLVPADLHPASVRRANGRGVLPPGSRVPPRQPSLRGMDAGVLVAFTDEESMKGLVAPGSPIQLMYAIEVMEFALSRDAGVLLYLGRQDSMGLVPARCREVRRLLGRSPRA